MACEILNIADAVLEAKKKKYALIYELSNVYVGPQKDDFALDNNILEAHFFDEDSEIKITRSGDSFIGFRIYESEEDEVIKKKTSLTISNQKLNINSHLDCDEDGQYRETTQRLVSLEGGI